MQQQLVQLFAFGGYSSSPDAVALVWQEANLVFDLVAAGNLAAQGTPPTDLITDIQNLSAALAVNPFYNTAVGYQVAVLTGALSHDALTKQ
jgi:hypothetical protein